MTISLVNAKTVIVVVKIHIVIEIIDTTILGRWGYINKTLHWGNKVIFSVHVFPSYDYLDVISVWLNPGKSYLDSIVSTWIFNRVVEYRHSLYNI